MTVTSFFMLHVATALLPPQDEIDYEYYTILNLPKKPSVTLQQIRKAYKLLSLQLHPDKIAQKQRTSNAMMSVEEAAMLYEKVQEAVNVLSDDSKRQVYINYNYSVARYKFIMNEESSFQHMIEQVVKNIQHSSCYHRTKLWLFIVLFVSLLLLLQPILIAMKINSITGSTRISNNNLKNTSWYYILIPFWICYVGYTLLFIVLVFMKSLRERIRYGPPKTNRPKITYWTILGIVSADVWNDTNSDDDGEDDDDAENPNDNDNSRHRDATTTEDDPTHKWKHGSRILNSELVIQFLNGAGVPIAILVGMILVIQQWEKNSDELNHNNNNSNNKTSSDDVNDDTNWIYTAIPFYVAIFCVVVSTILSLQQIHYVQSCIISNANPILANATTKNDFDFQNVNSEDTNDDRPSMKMIKQTYMIVEPDPEKLQITLEVMRQMKMMYQQQQEQEQQDSEAQAPVEDDEAITDEEMEYIRVQCSDEFNILERIKKEYYKKITTIVMIYVTQLTLILCQIQQTISPKSWYIVFLPLLIYYGLPIFTYCCMSCCTSSSSSSINTIPTEHDRPNVPMNDSEFPNNKNGSSSHTPLAHTVDSTTANQSNHSDIENSSNPPGIDSSVDPSNVTTAKVVNGLNNDTTVSNQEKKDGASTNTAATSLQPNISTPSTSANGTHPKQNNTSPPDEHNDGDDDDEDAKHDQDHPYYQSLDPDEERERATRGMNCCSSCCILIVLCLIIAKLEQSYSTDAADNNESDNEESFNTMWILFPLFLLSGCIILMFTCCICLPSTVPPDQHIDIAVHGMGTDSNDNAAASTTTTTQKPSDGTVPSAVSYQNQNAGSVPQQTTMIIPIPPPPPPTIHEPVHNMGATSLPNQTLDHSTSIATAGNEDKQHDVAIGGNDNNMYDLD